jgi:hypothetical protein
MADATNPTPLATVEETAKRVEEQATEYGTYVASQQIFFNGVIAYNIGDPVPVSNVKKHKYDEQGLVETIKSKAGQDLIRQLHEATTGEVIEQVQPTVSLGVPVPESKK